VIHKVQQLQLLIQFPKRQFCESLNLWNSSRAVKNVWAVNRFQKKAVKFSLFNNKSFNHRVKILFIPLQIFVSAHRRKILQNR
jgi:hypothetical protein